MSPDHEEIQRLLILQNDSLTFTNGFQRLTLAKLSNRLLKNILHAVQNHFLNYLHLTALSVCVM